MIFPSNRVRIMVATKPVDFRKGHNGLAALVKNELRKDPFTGTVFVFRSRRADRLKLLYWDGTGLVMACKRLDEHTFTWPAIPASCSRASASLSPTCQWSLTGSHVSTTCVVRLSNTKKAGHHLDAAALQTQLIQIGVRVVWHARAITFQLAEVSVSGNQFNHILAAIQRLRAPPVST